MPNAMGLIEANISRVLGGAERAVPAAQAALDTGRLPNVLAAAARLRVQHPDASLRDLARMAGVSKDTFTGRMRRVVAVGQQTLRIKEAAQEPRRRIGWSQLAIRVMGGFLTIPTTGTLREVAHPGLRIIAVTNILNALSSLESRYRGVLEDAAVELYRKTADESHPDTTKADIVAEVAARSDLIDPAVLSRRIGDDKRRTYRKAWYENAA